MKLEDLPQSAHDFLAETRFGTLVTNADPWPHAVPVWYEWTGTVIEMFSKRERPKNRRLRDDPRCSFVVSSEVAEPVYWVAIDGEATVTPDGAELAYAFAPRYWDLSDPELAATFAEWQATPERFERITITPHRVRHFTG